MILAIYGTGGLGRTLNDYIPYLTSTYDDFVFIDDFIKEERFRDRQVFSFKEFCSKFSAYDAEIVIAVGEPKYRQLLSEKIKSEGYKLGNFICNNSIVSKYAKVGEGVIILPYARVQDSVILHNNVCVCDNSVVAHDSEIYENTVISANCVLSGNVLVESNVYCGLSSSVREKSKVGRNSILSMGAVIMRDVPENVIVMGNPAKVISNVAEEKIFKDYFHG